MEIKVSVESDEEGYFGVAKISSMGLKCGWYMEEEPMIIDIDIDGHDARFKSDDPIMLKLKTAIDRAVKEQAGKDEVTREFMAEMALENYMEQRHDENIDDGR